VDLSDQPIKGSAGLRLSVGGFTLVELLVILAIVLVLLSLLMPNLRRGREIARRLGCGNNMRQIMFAALSYEADTGRLPDPNWGGGTKGWLYGADGLRDNIQHLKNGLLWPYLQDHRVYRCPSDRLDPDTVPNRPNNTRMITSYISNGSLCAYGKRPKVGSSFLTYRSGDFKSTDVLFWEPDEHRTGGWWNDGSNFPWEGIAARHFDRATAVCVDGHVEWFQVPEWNDLANTAPRPNRLWNVPGSANGRDP